MKKTYPAKEQGIEKDETPEEKKLNIETGEEDESVYNEEGRELELEDDEIENWEEGFMEGAEGKGHKGVCEACGKILLNDKTTFEGEFDGKIRWFCSEKCIKDYKKKKKL